MNSSDWENSGLKFQSPSVRVGELLRHASLMVEALDRLYQLYYLVIGMHVINIMYNHIISMLSHLPKNILVGGLATPNCPWV